MLRVKIDGKEYTATSGSTILQVARANGIYIPTLCDDPRLEPYGGCRLCIVEIKGMARPVTACTTPISDGMDITTTNESIEGIRKTLVELLLSDHPNDCMVCEKAGECTLQELAYFYGIRELQFPGERRIYEKKDGNPFIERDMEKCILCGKCVRVCSEIQGVGAIDIAYKGFNAKITPPFEKDLDCEFCGQCVAVCPTGALTGRQWAQKGRQAKEVDTTCAYCGTGCQITLHVRRNEVVRVTSKEDTWNEGWLCVKGRFGYQFIGSPDRLKTPLIRKNGSLKEATWDEALDYSVKRLKEIKEKYGPDSIGGLSSARCTTEENYLFQKFIRAVIGTNNVDHCARL
jgi:predicted molibdopterin-dependent oxidoreductase YjgC